MGSPVTVIYHCCQLTVRRVWEVIKMSDLGDSQSNNYLYIKEPITNNNNDNTALLKNC
jgi:hypothetical protein